ncbi:hypothetical protein [Paenibacillus sp. IHBB 10380]|uniref:hypothetical protein n=1 Tax=Paenibacillus sp. IHBB 10380 TaxID=1566358 RepID=UPI000A9BF047|nr:hypothetical protein [Paenibacillus sp. IHBB 10380]
MNLEKQLPIQIPLIHGRMYYAFPLCILATGDEYYPWFVSNFIQLQAFNDVQEQGIAELRFFDADHPYCFDEVLDVENTIIKANDVEQQIIEAIVQNRYVYTYVDKYEVSDNPFTGKKHVTQEILIYGYNLTERVFYILGFNKSRLFAYSTVKFDEVTNGIIHAQNKEFYLLKQKSGVRHEFDLSHVIQLTEDYLQSSSSPRHKRISSSIHLTYGLNVYSSLIESLNCMHMKEGALVTNIAYLHILWEHKKMMLMRLDYMSSHQMLSADGSTAIWEQCKQIETEVYGLRSKILKYEIVQNDKLIHQIKQSLHQMVSKEREMLTMWLDMMKEFVHIIPTLQEFPNQKVENIKI